MAWWKRRLEQAANLELSEGEFRTACTLYSRDGKRAAEVREFSNGETYLLESEWHSRGVFVDRHSGRLVGPFPSPKEAERFIVATPWFVGDSTRWVGRTLWTLVCVVFTMPALWLAIMAASSLGAGYAWRDMDWNDDGRTSVGEFLEAGDTVKQEVVIHGQRCVQVVAMKDALVLKTKCAQHSFRP